jgi:hypothetical protein
MKEQASKTIFIHILTSQLKAGIAGPETSSTARQQRGKHVSMATKTCSCINNTQAITRQQPT